MSQSSLDCVLVVKLADLGDALLTAPAIASLRAAYPDARIDALTTPNGAAAMALMPGLSSVIPFPKELFDRPAGALRPQPAATLARLSFDLRSRHYDAVVLLHHLTTGFGALKYRALATTTGAPIRAGLDNGAGSFLTHRAPDFGLGPRPEWQYALDVVGTLGAAPTDWSSVPIAVPGAARASAATLLEQAGVFEPYVVIHPGVGPYSPARAWPLERFVAVARRLSRESEVTLVTVGGPHDRSAGAALAEAGVVDLAGRTSFDEVAAIVDRSALVVGADSGIVQLAGVLARPLVAVFGPSNADAWRPIGAVEHHVGNRPIPTAARVAVRAALPCSPCFYIGYSLGRRDGCELKTCLDLVTENEVSALALGILARELSVNSGGPDAIDRPPTLP